MIYISKITNTTNSPQNSWDKLVSIITENATAKDKDNNKSTLLYKNSILEDFSFTEQIHIDNQNLKINTRLISNPTYRGETIFQIITPEDEFLKTDQTTIACLIAWRMHPGIFESPRLDLEQYIEEILKKI